jgi:hypothetical protein
LGRGRDLARPERFASSWEAIDEAMRELDDVISELRKPLPAHVHS